jgi:hypothetical protein
MLVLNVQREFPQVSDRIESDLVLQHFRDLLLKEIPEQFHQRRDLGTRTFPVFGGERVESQVRNSEFSAGLSHSADRLDPLAVPFDAWKSALLRPTTVAIHDDGDMLGERFPLPGVSHCLLPDQEVDELLSPS